jgi:hypothetical protein
VRGPGFRSCSCLAMRGNFSIPSTDTGITPRFNELTHVYIFFSWGGQQRRVLAIEGKTPGSKPRDLSISWAFFCLLRPRGVRVPVPWRLVRTPRVSGHVAAARNTQLYLLQSFANFFPTPLDNVIPFVSFHDTCRSCRRGRSREGDVVCERTREV